MKNVFLISTQLFVRLKVLKNALLEHRGLQTILTKIAKFVDRYAQEFFGTQVTTEPGIFFLFIFNNWRTYYLKINKLLALPPT